MALIRTLGKELGDQGQERRHIGDFLAEPKAWKARVFLGPDREIPCDSRNKNRQPV